MSAQPPAHATIANSGDRPHGSEAAVPPLPESLTGLPKR